MEQVRLGIIGIGGMGSGHAMNIAEGKVHRMVLISESADWIGPERVCRRKCSSLTTERK